MFHEFPKQLYRQGWKDLSDTVVVNSADEEAGARADGFKMLSEPDEPAPAESDTVVVNSAEAVVAEPKPARKPRKAAEPAPVESE